LIGGALLSLDTGLFHHLLPGRDVAYQEFDQLLGRSAAGDHTLTCGEFYDVGLAHDLVDCGTIALAIGDRRSRPMNQLYVVPHDVRLQSLSHTEPISGRSKRKLEHGEQTLAEAYSAAHRMK
jgi:hypothetical protein